MMPREHSRMLQYGQWPRLTRPYIRTRQPAPLDPKRDFLTTLTSSFPPIITYSCFLHGLFW